MTPVIFGLVLFAGSIIGFTISQHYYPGSITQYRTMLAAEPVDMSWGERASILIGVVCMLIGASVLCAIGYYLVSLVR
jgi:hypothetical protein